MIEIFAVWPTIFFWFLYFNQGGLFSREPWLQHSAITVFYINKHTPNIHRSKRRKRLTNKSQPWIMFIDRCAQGGSYYEADCWFSVSCCYISLCINWGLISHFHICFPGFWCQRLRNSSWNVQLHLQSHQICYQQRQLEVHTGSTLKHSLSPPFALCCFLLLHVAHVPSTTLVPIPICCSVYLFTPLHLLLPWLDPLSHLSMCPLSLNIISDSVCCLSVCQHLNTDRCPAGEAADLANKQSFVRPAQCVRSLSAKS